MLYRFHCLDCDYEWEDGNTGYPKKCPECESEEFEELYLIECRECGYQFIGAENDECPECQGLETYEI